ncbi:MAG: hypothetical protein AAGE76_03260 [Pseudomonadota bacterium]
MKPTAERALSGESLSAAELATFAKENDTLLREMHAIVGMYEAL